jgi:hypothetical protein
MRGTSESFSLNEGYNRQGIHTEFIFQGDEVVRKQTFDAQPFLEAAHAERQATAGQRWGDMRKVGTIPMAIYASALEIRDQQERQKFILKWLRENPAMVTFEKFLK